MKPRTPKARKDSSEDAKPKPIPQTKPVAKPATKKKSTPKSMTEKKSTPTPTREKEPTTQTKTVELVGKSSSSLHESQDHQAFPASLVSDTSTTIFDLPPELRNEIYSYILGPSRKIQVSLNKPFVREPALLAISHQIRAEAFAIWYGENLFFVNGSSPAVRFMRALSDDHLRCIRSVYIEVTAPRSVDDSKDRIRGLMREFEPRGLSRQAIHFEIMRNNSFEFANLERLKRLAKEGYIMTETDRAKNELVRRLQAGIPPSQWEAWRRPAISDI